MKQLLYKLEAIRRYGLGVAVIGDALCIQWRVYEPHKPPWRVLMLFGNPSFRVIREKLAEHAPQYVKARP